MVEYINREAFEKSVDERYCKPCKGAGKDHNGCWCRACWVNDMLDEVECFPAACWAGMDVGDTTDEIM